MVISAVAAPPDCPVASQSMTIPSTTDRRSGRDRHIEPRSGRRVHVIEAGEGPPVVFLHGSSTSSLSLLPVLERLEGVRAIAVDRPGFGLSEPVRVPRERFRDAAVEFLDEVLDELGLQTSAFAGNSMGGTWAVWYALARPERVRRLVLLGSAPLLPGTRPPVPLRVTAAPLARRPAAPRGQAQPQAARPVDGIDGREGHHRALPGADRVARGGRQGPDRLGREPRRAAGGHHSPRIPAVGADGPGRVAAAERPDVADLGRPRPRRNRRGRARDGTGSCLGRNSSCCQPATSPTSVTHSECPSSLSTFIRSP